MTQASKVDLLIDLNVVNVIFCRRIKLYVGHFDDNFLSGILSIQSNHTAACGGYILVADVFQSAVCEPDLFSYTVSMTTGFLTLVMVTFL